MTSTSSHHRRRRSYPTRVTLLRLLALGGFLTLAMLATGCDELIADVLAGDDCGHHSLCSHHAAAAGAAAGLAGAAGAYVQRQEDNPKGPWPWERDQADLDAELDDMLDDTDADAARHDHLEESDFDLDDELDLDADESIEDILGPSGQPEAATDSTPTDVDEIPEDGSAPWDRESESTPTDDGSATEAQEEPEQVESGPEKPPSDDGAKTGQEAAASSESNESKPVSPAEGYMPLTTVGDVTILVNPDTHQVAVQGGTYIGGKDQDGYWVTDDNKVVRYDPDTGKYSVTDGQFTASHEGSTYTVTKDNQILVYDHVNEGFTISDGHFTAVRDDTIYAVTKGDKILAFDQATGEFIVSDGHFTASHDGTTYAVTKDNQIISYDEASGNIKVSDGHFTATREGTVYSVTNDDKVLTYDESSGNFRVTDGHYVLERDGSVTAFTKDDVKIEYDRDSHGVMVTTSGTRGSLSVGAAEDGQFGLDTTVKGSIDGTPTTFGLTATRYNLPETGGQGFAGGLSLEQNDFEFHAAYVQEPTETGFSVDVRKDDWTVGFQRYETFGPQGTDTKNYSLGWRDVKLNVQEGGGGTLSTAAFTHRF